MIKSNIPFNKFYKRFSITVWCGTNTTLISIYLIASLLTVLYIEKKKKKEGLI